MHRHDILGWKRVVQERKHAFLDLASIRAATDQNQTAGEIAGNDSLATRTVLCRICLEAREAHNSELGREDFQLGIAWPTKHVADEVGMPCQFGKYARCQPVVHISAAEQVLDVKFLVFCKG